MAVMTKTYQYISVEHQPRYPYSSYLYNDESCYTDTELTLREKIIELRRNADIDEKYLPKAKSWFADELDAGFTDTHKDSYFFDSKFKPKDKISSKNFIIQSLNPKSVHWPINNIIKNIGDYLSIRNAKLPETHFNQPQNFFLLDAIEILKNLAHDSDAELVYKNLNNLIDYIRKVEMLTPPTQGSDRFFLANLRELIDKDVKMDVIQVIESQKLRVVFKSLLGATKHYHELTNTFMHFALTDAKINPHAYIDSMPLQRGDNDLSRFPVLALTDCAKEDDSSELTVFNSKLYQQIEEEIKINPKLIEECQSLKLIDKLDESTQESYVQAVANLVELKQFTHVLENILTLLDDAGEVITVINFNQQITALLKAFDLYIHKAHETTANIKSSNKEAYYKAIQDKQELSFYERHFTDKEEELKQFIDNQDALAQHEDVARTRDDLYKEIISSCANIQSTLNELKVQAEIQQLQEKALHLFAQTENQIQALVTRHQKLNGIALPGPKSNEETKALPQSITGESKPVEKQLPFASPRVVDSPSSSSMASLVSNESHQSKLSTDDALPTKPEAKLLESEIKPVVTPISHVTPQIPDSSHPYSTESLISNEPYQPELCVDDDNIDISYEVPPQTSSASRLKPPFSGLLNSLSSMFSSTVPDDVVDMADDIVPISDSVVTLTDDVALLEANLYVPPTSSTLPCIDVKMSDGSPEKLCFGPNDGRVFVAPIYSQSTELAIYDPNVRGAPINADNYNQSCYPISHYGMDTVACQGENTIAFIQPGITTAERIVNQAPATLMLMLVLIQLGKDLSSMLFSKNDESEDKEPPKPLSEKDFHDKIANLEDNLAKAYTLANNSVDNFDRWTVFSHEDDICDLKENYKRDPSKVTTKELDELNEDICYFNNYIEKELSQEMALKSSKVQVPSPPKVHTLNSSQVFFTPQQKPLPYEPVEIMQPVKQLTAD
jgi:hypothetical protein